MSVQNPITSTLELCVQAHPCEDKDTLRATINQTKSHSSPQSLVMTFLDDDKIVLNTMSGVHYFRPEKLPADATNENGIIVLAP